MAPDQDLGGRGAAFERAPEGYFSGSYHAREQHPDITVVAELGLVQRDAGFLRIGADAARHDFDLGRFLFEGRVQLTTEHVQIVAADRVIIGLIARELRQHRVTVLERVDQIAPFFDGSVDAPFLALIESRDLLPFPTPRLHHVVQHVDTPVFGRLRTTGREAQIDLDVEAASKHIQPHGIIARQQVLFDLGVHENVGVETVETDVFGFDALLVTLAEQGDVGELGRVGLHQQQLQDRLVGRLDTFVELPHGGAKKLFDRNTRQAAEIDVFTRVELARGDCLAYVVVVVALEACGHAPPQRAQARDQHTGPIKFVEQQ